VVGRVFGSAQPGLFVSGSDSAADASLASFFSTSRSFAFISETQCMIIAYMHTHCHDTQHESHFLVNEQALQTGAGIVSNIGVRVKISYRSGRRDQYESLVYEESNPGICGRLISLNFIQIHRQSESIAQDSHASSLVDTRVPLTSSATHYLQRSAAAKQHGAFSMPP